MIYKMKNTIDKLLNFKKLQLKIIKKLKKKFLINFYIIF